MGRKKSIKKKGDIKSEEYYYVTSPNPAVIRSTIPWIEIFKWVGMKILGTIGDNIFNYIKQKIIGSENQLEDMIKAFRDDINSALTDHKIKELSGIVKNANRSFDDYYQLLKEYFENPYTPIPPETMVAAKEKLKNADDLFDNAISQTEQFGIAGFALYLVSTPVDLLVKKERCKYVPNYENIYKSRIHEYIDHINSLFDKWPKVTEDLYPTGVPRTRFKIHQECIKTYNKEIFPNLGVLDKWGKIINYTSPFVYCRFLTRLNTYITCCDEFGALELIRSSSYNPPRRDQMFWLRNLEENISPIILPGNRSYLPVYHNNKISIQVRTREYINCINSTGLVEVRCNDEPTNDEIFYIEKISGSSGDLIRSGDIIAIRTRENYYFNHYSKKIHGHNNCSTIWDESYELFQIVIYNIW